MFALSILASGGEQKPGLPYFVTITASEPATIYYTYDGSDPTIYNAYVYTVPIPVPDDMEVFNVKAFAITADGDVSETFVKTFFEEVEPPIEQPFSRKGPATINQPGIVVDTGVDYQYNAVDADGDETAWQDEPDDDYEIVYEGDRVITVVSTPADQTGTLKDNDWVAQSSPSDVYFNPKAKVIVIDADDPDQVPEIIMRPYGSMRDMDKTYNGQELLEFGTYISGGYMMSYYSADTGRYAGYYFDTNDQRYVVVERDLNEGEFILDASRIIPWRRSDEGLGKVLVWFWPGRANQF